MSIPRRTCMATLLPVCIALFAPVDAYADAVPESRDAELRQVGLLSAMSAQLPQMTATRNVARI